jgi:hypothetical protein
MSAAELLKSDEAMVVYILTPVPFVPVDVKSKPYGISCSPSADVAGCKTPPSALATVNVNPSIVLLITLIDEISIPAEL